MKLSYTSLICSSPVEHFPCFLLVPSPTCYRQISMKSFDKTSFIFANWYYGTGHAKGSDCRCAYSFQISGCSEKLSSVQKLENGLFSILKMYFSMCILKQFFLWWWYYYLTHENGFLSVSYLHCICRCLTQSSWHKWTPSLISFGPLPTTTQHSFKQHQQWQPHVNRCLW